MSLLAVRCGHLGALALALAWPFASGAAQSAALGPVVEQAYLKPTIYGQHALFGSSVAVSGNTAVVGEPMQDHVIGVPDVAQSSGAAHVFVRVGSAWSPQAYLKPAFVSEYDWFGYAVAISGDTLVVAAPDEDSSATGVGGDPADDAALNSGAVYVFVRSGTTWVQQAYIKASNTGRGDRFGSSVALDGDTLVVGAPNEASQAAGVDGNQLGNAAPSSGAAYVFVRTGTTWTQQAYLKAAHGDAGDWFGTSLALSGDTLAVGAPGEDSGVAGLETDEGAPDSGAAYIFVRSGSAWAQQACLKATNLDAGDRFGDRVALDGDSLAVGAYREASVATGVGGNAADDSAPAAGAAYVFTRQGSRWSQQAYLKASNTDAGDWFGRSLAIAGDLLLVGAPFEDSVDTLVDGNQADDSAADAGAAYLFLRTGSAWAQHAYLKASNSEVGDNFGIAAGVAGSTLILGARLEDSAATGVNGPAYDNSTTRLGAAFTFVVQPPGG